MANDVTFKTTLLQIGDNTGIRVPDEIIEQFGSGKKPPVNVTINGFTYPSTVAVMGRAFMIPVSSAIRSEAAVKGGAPITVSLSLDLAPRTVAIPPDFQEALDNNAAAKTFFETLSNSSKKRYLSGIEGAKTNETRQKRIEKAVIDLTTGKP